jgi:hypothetical protein
MNKKSVMGFCHVFFCEKKRSKVKVVLTKKMPPELKRQSSQVEYKVQHIQESDSSDTDMDDEPDWATVRSRSIFQEPPRSSAVVDWKAFLAYKNKHFCSPRHDMMCDVYNRIWNGTLDDDDLLFLQDLGFLKMQ